MDNGAAVVCNAFLEKLPSQEHTALLRHLPDEQLHQLSHLKKPIEDPTLGTTPLEDELPRIHYSWLTPFLRSLPEGDIKLFMSCLSQDQIRDLKNALLYSNHLPSPSLLAETFLKKTLFASLKGHTKLLPFQCLPTSSLNILLEQTTTELRSLINLLSMHDLATEIRQIIDTTKLKQIYAHLSPAQTTFLKTLIHRKEPITFKKMGLSNWDGRIETLATILEQRGINRIAKALFAEDPSLTWYIAHRLDIQRGSTLLKLCSALDHPQAAFLLSEQVATLIQSLKHQDT